MLSGLLQLSGRDEPKLSGEPAQVAHVPDGPRSVDGRVLHLLREHGGHGHLRLRPHVSLLHLRHQAEKDVQRLLSNLPATNQRHYQDLPKHVRNKKKWTCESEWFQVSDATRKYFQVPVRYLVFRRFQAGWF